MAGAEHSVEGVLPVDKPAGPTSHDMVARARRALGTRRIGHTGTLDPFASGLLLLCVGRATRIAEYLSGMDKRYTAVVRLGVSTDTADATGAVLEQRDSTGIAQHDVEKALQAQRGSIMQIPPAYSAKKVAGERSYALARQGRAVPLEPVPVTIRELRIMKLELPDVHLDVLCSSGTYIRAIARDLGEALDVGAHLTMLRRTAVGPHAVAGAVTADVLEAAARSRAAARAGADGAAAEGAAAEGAAAEGAAPVRSGGTVSGGTAARQANTAAADAALHDALIPILDAIPVMPRIELSDEQVVHIRHGRTVSGGADVSGTVVLVAHDDLIAIGDAGNGLIRPRKVFL